MQHQAASNMSEAPQESKREEDKQDEQQRRTEPEPATDAGGASAPQAATTAPAAPAAAVHEQPPAKRIIRTPAPPAPKRATRASTGAPIALTAKGSLYKANKDTGERAREWREGSRRAQRARVEGLKNDERHGGCCAPLLQKPS